MADRKPRTMTVKELIEELQDLDPNALVLTQAPSGDYWGNTLALQIEQVDLLEIGWSEYHRAWRIGDDDKASCDPHKQTVVIIG